jgi:hypothetical protein
MSVVSALFWHVTGTTGLRSPAWAARLDVLMQIAHQCSQKASNSPFRMPPTKGRHFTGAPHGIADDV